MRQPFDEYKFKHRNISYGNIIINLHVVNTLPIIVGSDTWINKFAITPTKTINNPTPSQNILSLDSSYDNPVNLQKRYTFITVVTSVITLTSVYLYYDNVFKDILVLPDIESFISSKDNILVNLSVYRIGSKGPLNERKVYSQLGLEPDRIYPLPNFNKIESSNLVISIPGTYSPIESNQLLVESLSGIKKIQSYSFINLGKYSSILSSENTLPLYMLGNFKYGELGLDYLGVTSLANNNLYIPLNF